MEVGGRAIRDSSMRLLKLTAAKRTGRRDRRRWLLPGPNGETIARIIWCEFRHLAISQRADAVEKAASVRTPSSFLRRTLQRPQHCARNQTPQRCASRTCRSRIPNFVADLWPFAMLCAPRELLWAEVHMKDLALVMIRFLATTPKLSRPSGLRAVVTENAPLRQQRVVLPRSRRGAPNLTALDRFLFGFGLMCRRPRRIPKDAIGLRPSTCLKFYQALECRKLRSAVLLKRSGQKSWT